MIALRLVVDTNIGTGPILEEYRTVLSRPELQIRTALRQQFLQLLEKNAHFVVPERCLQITIDPQDNIFVECAEAARTDYLITGNIRTFRDTGERRRSARPANSSP